MGSITKSVEKAELHCHLDGVLDPAMLDEVRAAGIEAGIDRAALAAACPVRSKEEWLAKFTTLAPPQEARGRVAGVMLQSQIRRVGLQRVTYAEIMIGGLLAADSGPEGILETFRELRGIANAAGAAHGVRMEFLVAVAYREAGRFTVQAERMLMLHKAGLIRGIVIAGDEPRPSLAASERELGRLHDAGLGIEIHAGEWAGPESVRDALEHGRPDRIGHGVAIFRDEALLEEIRKRDIHIEMCPTSNVVTGAVARIEEHPVARARTLGMNYSVNSDDPAPFGCTMNSEFALLERVFGFTPADFETVRQNALRSSFANR